MQILSSPLSGKDGPILDKEMTALLDEQEFMTFQQHSMKDQFTTINNSQMISEHESESKSSVKTPFSKKKS